MSTVKNMVRPVLAKMTVEEHAMINVFLSLGKSAPDVIKGMEPATLKRKWGTKRPSCEIAENLKTAFQEGIGFVDSLFGLNDDYGKQLDFMIRKMLVKSFKVKKPTFDKDAATPKGALEREQWIVEQFLENWWGTLKPKAKKEIANIIAEEVKQKGIDPSKAAKISPALLTGGFTALRTLMGFQFHIVLAKIAGFLSRMIVAPLVGSGIKFATMAGLQRVAGLVFGPIGWIITIASLIPTITSLIAPREYDKYIPVIFLIGLKRLAMKEKTTK